MVATARRTALSSGSCLRAQHRRRQHRPCRPVKRDRRRSPRKEEGVAKPPFRNQRAAKAKSSLPPACFLQNFPEEDLHERRTYDRKCNAGTTDPAASSFLFCVLREAPRETGGGRRDCEEHLRDAAP